MIIVSLNGNDIFSPHPALVVRDQVEAFKTGLALLERFSHRIVITARESSLKALARIPEVMDRITDVTQDTYPAWNPEPSSTASSRNLRRTHPGISAWLIFS